MIQPWPDLACSMQDISLASSLLPFTPREYRSHHGHRLMKLKFKCSVKLGIMFGARALTLQYDISCTGGSTEWSLSPCIHEYFIDIWIHIPVELPKNNLTDSVFSRHEWIRDLAISVVNSVLYKRLKLVECLKENFRLQLKPWFLTCMCDVSQWTTTFYRMRCLSTVGIYWHDGSSYWHDGILLLVDSAMSLHGGTVTSLMLLGKFLASYKVLVL